MQQRVHACLVAVARAHVHKKVRLRAGMVCTPACTRMCGSARLDARARARAQARPKMAHLRAGMRAALVCVFAIQVPGIEPETFSVLG